jgi:hypothetical protein
LHPSFFPSTNYYLLLQDNSNHTCAEAAILQLKACSIPLLNFN